MPSRSAAADGPAPPARTHKESIELFRRPFAPGAIGFRAMSKVPCGGDLWGGAQVAAYIGAQSVLQRLNCVAPARWRMTFGAVEGDLLAAAADGQARRRLYLACRLTVTLPAKPGGPDVDAVYEDVGEQPNRDTLAAIERGGFRIERCRGFGFPADVDGVSAWLAAYPPA